MRPADVVFAVVVAVFWGSAFVATKIGLESFSPSQLTALRFVVAAVPVLFLPRPRIPWRMLIVLGCLLYLGQFMCLFFAMANGMPPGLASVIVHVQAFFTIVIAAFVLRERPTVRQVSSVVVAFAGLAVVATTIGGDLTALGLGMTLVGALSLASGNVLLKRVGKVDMVALMAWLSIVPPLPALAFSTAAGDMPGIGAAVAAAPWPALLSVLYLGAVATTFSFALWGRLLGAYPAAMVAPFALLAPCFGTLSSYVAFGETFGPVRGAGMALIMAGLAVSVLPFGRGFGRAPSRS